MPLFFFFFLITEGTLTEPISLFHISYSGIIFTMSDLVRHVTCFYYCNVQIWKINILLFCMLILYKDLQVIYFLTIQFAKEIFLAEYIQAIH